MNFLKYEVFSFRNYRFTRKNTHLGENPSFLTVNKDIFSLKREFFTSFGKCFLLNYICENISCFGSYLNSEISVYLFHWHFISFNVTNTLDWKTFLVQK